MTFPTQPVVPYRHEQVTRRASGFLWLEHLVRFGYVVRGIIYGVPGLFALRLALGGGGTAVTQAGAILVIGHQPFGRLLLILVAFGLAAYALWGFIRALLDALDYGNSPLGLARRCGFLLSGFAYLGLLVATVQLFSNPASGAAPGHDWAEAIRARPWGAWALGAIGLLWIAGGGISEIVGGWRGRFERDLDLERMGTRERVWARRLGRFGIVARGAVFTVSGILLVASAFAARPHHASGLDDALLGIAHEPYGLVLLAGAALGLIAFGLYSVLCARWMRVRIARSYPGSL